jgi:hypothetical protein
VAFSNFDDLAWHIGRLQRARRGGHLVPVLGSGINSDYGLPDWPKLIVEVLLDSGRIRKAKAVGEEGIRGILEEVIRDPLLQAVAVRSAFAREDQWLAALKRHVKQYRVDDVVDPAKPIGKIAALIKQQYLADRHRHIAVLTFNYDDVLEVALQSMMAEEDREKVHPVTNEKDFFGSLHRAGIFIYHLHGYVWAEEHDIVLDAGSYVNILSSPGRHWSWQCMNRYLFHGDTAVLFLGLSLLDPSLRLLLTQAAVRGLALSGVYVARPFPALEDQNPDRLRRKAFAATDIVRLFDGVLRELSLVPYFVKSWDELPAFLDHIAAEEGE